MNTFALSVLVVCCLHLSKCLNVQDRTSKTVRLPLSTFSGKNRLLYACTAIKLEPNQYITGFEPLVEKYAVRHMSIQLCDDVGDRLLWDCLKPLEVCHAGKRDSLYAWINPAPGWQLPDSAGIYTGNYSRYAVFQVHGKDSGEYQPGYAGMRIGFRKSKPENAAAMMVLANTGYIPAKTRDFTTDTACTWNYNVSVPLLNYGFHTHSWGSSASLYLIRNGIWIEIGRADVGYPTVIYDITHKHLFMQPGDIIASRCTFDNNEDRNIKMGFSDTNEMCNAYLHFGVPHDSPPYVRSTLCEANIQEFSWEKSLKNIPKRASDVSGDTDQNRYVIKYHLEKVNY